MKNTDEQKTTIAPALKPGQRISIHGNIIESFNAALEAPAEKLPKPSGNMNALRIEGGAK